MPRYGNRKDAVHGPIVEGLRRHGVAVLDMPIPGDVLCYYEGRYIPIEFKSDKSTRGYVKEATPAQERRAETMPIPIAHTLGEALALFGLTEVPR